MGGVQTTVRAPWRIANLTTCDLYGQDPALQIPNPITQMPGKHTKGWLGEVSGGAKPLLGAAKRPLCERVSECPFTCRDANK
jgi:hypothetical protein